MKEIFTRYVGQKRLEHTMIKDPTYWRRDLLRSTQELERRSTQGHWTEATFARTEQIIMLGFYSVRKLLDAGKASHQIDTRNVPLIEYQRGLHRSQPVYGPILQAHYDLDFPHQLQAPLRFVSNQVVHSYVFAIAVGYKSGFAGIYFASERERNERMFFLEARELITLFCDVARDRHSDDHRWIEERLATHRVQTAFPPRSRVPMPGRP